MNTKFVYPPAHTGEQEMFLLTGTGPASYSTATGDIISNPGVGEFIGCPHECVTQSGNYVLRPVPSAVNTLRPVWAWRWVYAGSQSQSQGVVSAVIATAGSGQTNGTYTANAAGGGGSGAVLQYVIAGGALTSVKVINPGSGYTSAPGFTIAAGGTSGTVTATVGALGGMEVANGANLSAESVQFTALGGQL